MTHIEKMNGKIANHFFKQRKRKPQIIRNGEKGRWTTDEHLVFVKMLIEHGTNWKKIQEILKVRTST